MVRIYWQCPECGSIQKKDNLLIEALKKTDSNPISDTVNCSTCKKKQDAKNVYSGNFDFLRSDDFVENLLPDSEDKIFNKSLKRWIYKGELVRLAKDYKEVNGHIQPLLPDIPASIIREYIINKKTSFKSLLLLFLINIPIAILLLLFISILVKQILPVILSEWGSAKSFIGRIAGLIGVAIVFPGSIIIYSYCIAYITKLTSKFVHCTNARVPKYASVINVFIGCTVFIIFYYYLQYVLKFYNFSLSHLLLLTPKGSLIEYIFLSVCMLIILISTFIFIRRGFPSIKDMPYCEKCEMWYTATNPIMIDVEWSELIINAISQKKSSLIKGIKSSSPDFYPRLVMQISYCPNCNSADFLFEINYESETEINTKEGKKNIIVSHKYLKTLVPLEIAKEMKEIIYK